VELLRYLAAFRHLPIEFGEEVAGVGVAAAGSLFEDRAIDDPDIATSAGDRSAGGEFLDGARHAWTAHAEHQGDRVVRHVEHTVDHPIVHAQKPPGEPRDDRMSGVTPDADAAAA